MSVCKFSTPSAINFSTNIVWRCTTRIYPKMAVVKLETDADFNVVEVQMLQSDLLSMTIALAMDGSLVNGEDVRCLAIAP